MEEEEQEMSFVETVFDNRENDWLGFAKQQMEFYQNAGQYMVNLQIEIQTFDEKIEDLMEKIENANYNVTQGYKVFKELKDLRNGRKAKTQELNVLRIMTECFDVNSMADALSYNLDEIEKITAGAVEEEMG
jgi:predicted RNase H-like nuclease (RuvC/YqgF family)